MAQVDTLRTNEGGAVDLADAIAAHIRWKIRLLQCLEGTAEPLRPEEVGRDDLCELGRWLKGDGREHSERASFSETSAVHAQFHACAAEVVRAIVAGDKQRAEDSLGVRGEFSKASDAVIFALTKLRGEVRKSGGE